MIVAIVDFFTTAENRQKALDTLLAEVRVVSAMQGCQTFRPYTDPASDTHVGVIHEWENIDRFQVYATSDAFARSGAALRPLMTAPPSSRRYEARLIEDVK